MAGREGLLRHFLRPWRSHERLRHLPSKAGGAVIPQLKKPWQDRPPHVELTPSAFIARLASLVPPPSGCSANPSRWAAPETRPSSGPRPTTSDRPRARAATDTCTRAPERRPNEPEQAHK